MTEPSEPRRKRRRRWPWIALAVVLGLLVGTGIARQLPEDELEHATIGTFNVLPDPLPPGQPGELIRSEPLLGAPGGAVAWRSVPLLVPWLGQVMSGATPASTC